MEWRGRRGSRNVEDRRGMGRAGAAGGVGIVGMLAILAVGYFFGIDISPIVGAMDDGGQPGEARELTPEEQEVGQFVSVVLADTEEVWASILPAQAGVDYVAPQLVMFSGIDSSACGTAQSAMGPFYCPNDRTVYLDTDFFRTMQTRMDAGGDFAFAYVIAHEVGHHVQNQLGILGQTMQARQQSGQADANRISVMTELQADCFAGIWARQANEMFGTLQPGDIEEAMNAAAAVGDDRLMEKAGRAPMRDSFTHGSSAERQEWFDRGFNSGELAQCNTFKAAGL
ncbi:KPN_02809 family neutral zinc metallopeptidase [Paracoccus yeei]|uniref:KPN_02809 family neutral zinc metallopeptidase n=1 Tax=Paracoccus yeei TaxID=147645 RepID=UPI003BF7D9A8